MKFRSSFVAAVWLLAALPGLGQETPAPTPPPAEPPTGPSPTPAPVTAGGAVNPTFFNPAIAVIGNFLAFAGHNPVDNQPSFQVKLVSAAGVGLSYAWDLPTGATIIATFGAMLLVVAGHACSSGAPPRRVR